MSEVIKVLYVQPKKKPEVRYIVNTQKAFKELVDGTIIDHYPFRGRTVFIINGTAKNVGGQREGSPPNRTIRSITGGIKEIIHCSFIICGKRRGRYVSLTARELKRFSAMFSKPEVFYPIGNGKMKIWTIADDEHYTERIIDYEKYLQGNDGNSKQPVDTGSGRE